MRHDWSLSIVRGCSSLTFFRQTEKLRILDTNVCIRCMFQCSNVRQRPARTSTTSVATVCPLAKHVVKNRLRCLVWISKHASLYAD